MGQFVALTFTSLAGSIMAITTEVGVTPFFFVSDVSDHWGMALWGVAPDTMVLALLFSLVSEGLASGMPLQLGIGMLVGVVLVLIAHHVIEGTKINPRQYGEADFRKLLLILGILTVHNFPESVAVGVSFVDLDLDGSLQLFGFVVSLPAAFMTLAISVYNIPERPTISTPLRSTNASNWRLVWWVIFSSLPQPIGTVVAFYFVRIARESLPFGSGFAAGATVFLVFTELVPEALKLGKCFPCGNRVELLVGPTAGFAVMVPPASI